MRLNNLLITNLIFSKLMVIIEPNKAPIIVPPTPIIDPTSKNILKILLLSAPIVLSKAISLDLFLTRINKLVMTLNAATIMINESMRNITVLSVDSTIQKDSFISFQSRTIRPLVLKIEGKQSCGIEEFLLGNKISAGSILE